MRELKADGQRVLRYNLPNGMQVEYPASEQAYYFSSILLSIFEHDRYIRRLIVGLSGRNMRRALEIFLEFCSSGHIGADEITKIRISEGKYVLPLGLVTNVLLRANQRFYDSDASYLKNVFSADVHDNRPHFFARLLILQVLYDLYNSPGTDRLKSYIRVECLRAKIATFGVDESVFRRELEYLVRGFCVICEDFRQSNISDDDLVSIAPAGHVHLDTCFEQYYLAAIAEDSWFEQEEKARRVADRISDGKKHYENSTVLENAEDILEELEAHQGREAMAYKAIFSNDEFSKLTDLSRARSKLSRFEKELVDSSWVGANKKFPVGTIHEATVLNIASFGVFVELARDVRGLIHSSKLPLDFKSNNAFERGRAIFVRILNVDRMEKRIELDWIESNSTGS